MKSPRASPVAFKDAACGTLPGEFLCLLPPPFNQGYPWPITLRQHQDCAEDILLSRRIHQDAGITHNLRNGGDVGTDDRRTEAHRLQDRQAKPLEQGWVDHRVTVLIKPLQGRIIEASRHNDSSRQIKIRHRSAEVLHQPALSSGHHRWKIRSC